MRTKTQKRQKTASQAKLDAPKKKRRARKIQIARAKKDTAIKKASKAEAAEVLADVNASNASTEALETAINNSFFYTSDKFFATLDHKEILANVIKHYPAFSAENTDSVIKKALIEMLENEEFMTKTLDFYNLSIYDFFMALHKNYAPLFKGPFLKKIKLIIQKKRYAQKLKRPKRVY